MGKSLEFLKAAFLATLTAFSVPSHAAEAVYDPIIDVTPLSSSPASCTDYETGSTLAPRACFKYQSFKERFAINSGYQQIALGYRDYVNDRTGEVETAKVFVFANIGHNKFNGQYTVVITETYPNNTVGIARVIKDVSLFPSQKELIGGRVNDNKFSASKLCKSFDPDNYSKTAASSGTGCRPFYDALSDVTSGGGYYLLSGKASDRKANNGSETVDIQIAIIGGEMHIFKVDPSLNVQMTSSALSGAKLTPQGASARDRMAAVADLTTGIARHEP